MRTPYNDDHSLIGVEGDWKVKYDTCVVFVKATNSKEDWLSNLIAIPFPLQLVGKLGWCHLGYRGYAYWLTGMIHTILSSRPEVTKLVVVGYSMGGGIAQMVGVLADEWIDDVTTKIVSIDGPRTTSRLPKNIKLLRNRGSLVADIPPWFKKAPETVLSTTCRPFWKAHKDYDIEAIIKNEE